MKDERDPIERRYAAALSALDEAGNASPVVSRTAAAAAADVVRLNQAWNTTHARDQRAGVVSRIFTELGRLMPWRRRRIQGAMIAAINRNTETTRALIDATQHFHSHVIWYAQTVGMLAAAPRRGEMGPQSIESLRQGYDALSHEWMSHRESQAARDQRAAERMAAMTKAYEELREVAAMAQQGTAALKRIVDAGGTGGRPAGARDSARGPAAEAAPVAPASADTNAFKYVGFEDRFRGSRESIRERLLTYLPLLAGASNVVDVGCGRGELLDLLREQGVSARGVDINAAMVAECQARGLAAEQGDGLAWLESQPDDSLGAVVAIQVVEHLEPDYLLRWLETAHHKLKPGAPLILETINVACWAAFFDSYIRDLTHVRPLHPDTLRYVVQASGFLAPEVRFQSPVSNEDRLASVRMTPGNIEASQTVLDLVETVNSHAERLNQQLFTHRDYAIVARR